MIHRKAPSVFMFTMQIELEIEALGDLVTIKMPTKILDLSRSEEEEEEDGDEDG